MRKKKEKKGEKKRRKKGEKKKKKQEKKKEKKKRRRRRRKRLDHFNVLTIRHGNMQSSSMFFQHLFLFYFCVFSNLLFEV